MPKNVELKAIREALGLTQTEMGAELGVKQSGYQRWEDQGETPASQEALARAREVYQQKKGEAWVWTGERPGYMFTPMPASFSFENPMTAGEAAQRASAILREVLTAAPPLREKWSDEDKDEFVGRVTQILTVVPKPAVEDTLRHLLLAVANGLMKMGR